MIANLYSNVYEESVDDSDIEEEVDKSQDFIRKAMAFILRLQEAYIIHDENRYLSLKSFSEENNMYLYKHKESHLRAHHQSFF